MKRMILIAFLFMIASSVVSCATSLTPPNGYAELDDPPMHDYVAFSADDVRIAVTVQEKPERSNNDFFYKAFMNKFVVNEGKKFIKDGDFTAKNQPGKYLVFEAEKTGIMYMYVIGFIIKGDDVYVIEAAGKKDKMEPDLDAIISSFGTLK